jgi:transposase-like protein
MDPQSQFCHNLDCPARGQLGQGNIHVHSRKHHRFKCTACGRTFVATRGTPFYRKRTSHETMTLVLTLLAHGCPLQAIVAAFDLDERTVAAWHLQTGQHAQRLHQHLVQQGQVDLQHVQADELSVKMVGRRVWMALAMAVPSRLWLGGVISPRRDLRLITAVARVIRSCALSLAILVCVDGLPSYITAITRAFRHPIRTGRPGRPRLEEEPGLLLGQVIKKRECGRVVGVAQHAVRGSEAAITAAVRDSSGGTGINTAYIERLNATFRGAATPLVRRTRALAREEATLGAGMFLVGCAYNFCWEHESLRLAATAKEGPKWRGRTPAMAAGLTDHRWTMPELLSYRVPPPPWVPPKRRGRPPKYQQARSVAA